MSDPANPFERMRAEVARCRHDPYLFTVTAAQRPHCAVVSPVWRGEKLLVAAPSSWPDSEAAGLNHVSLVWPPAQDGERSLIVDGTAVTSTAATDGAVLEVTIARMVWYRRKVVDGVPTRASDCLPIYRR